MKTFKDLYEFIRNCEEKNIINWLEESWSGKDKQEIICWSWIGG